MKLVLCFVTVLLTGCAPEAEPELKKEEIDDPYRLFFYSTEIQSFIRFKEDENGRFMVIPGSAPQPITNFTNEAFYFNATTEMALWSAGDIKGKFVGESEVLESSCVIYRPYTLRFEKDGTLQSTPLTGGRGCL